MVKKKTAYPFCLTLVFLFAAMKFSLAQSYVFLEEDVGTWVTHEITIFEDYQKAFGRKPPTRASLAIMNDSDNTGEQSVSFVDDIKILRQHNEPSPSPMTGDDV